MNGSGTRKDQSGQVRGDMAAGEPTADVVVDGGDRRCVVLLLELRRVVQQLPDGAVVHLIATDPAAPVDLPAWCHLTGHAYLGQLRRASEARPVYAIRVCASARSTDATRPWHVT